MTAGAGEGAGPALRHPLPHGALYAAFDRFPSTKGAGVHIGHASADLFDTFGGGLAYVLGGRGLPPYQLDPTPGRPVEVVRFDAPVPNLLDRTDAFSARLATVVGAHAGSLEVAQGRDPWGVRALAAPGRRHRVVYEVNSLPSVELPVSWPAAGPATVAKLEELERRCLAEADAVVAVSEVLARRLVAGGVAAAKVVVIPNGADVPMPGAPTPPRPADAPPGRYLVYVGAVQTWQGVDALLRAMTRLADLDVTLAVVCATPERRARPLRRLATRLGVDDRVRWHHGVRHADVAAWLAHAEVSVAPLTDCPRNVEQGCCPLKVLESMAAGTAVVASDLPVVRELVDDGVHGRLVPPDRPVELARALRVLLEYPDQAAALGAAAQSRVRAELTWAHTTARWREVYTTLT